MTSKPEDLLAEVKIQTEASETPSKKGFLKAGSVSPKTGRMLRSSFGLRTREGNAVASAFGLLPPRNPRWK